jgi:hypothetical protein
MNLQQDYHIWIYRISLACIAITLLVALIFPWLAVFRGLESLINGISLAEVAGITLATGIVSSPLVLIFSAMGYWSASRISGAENLGNNPRQLLTKRLVQISGTISVLFLVGVLLFMLMLQDMDLSGIR